ncbi:MAG: radical SAM protein [Lachnospiraceae bacterium]|nr:radical SAM protein [Lachnospiraceae bacterium]
MKKIRIAFATGDGISINRHFGAAERFDIYEVVYGKARARELVDRRTTAKACEGHQHHDVRMHNVVGLISDCNVVYAEMVGPGAREVLSEAGIAVVETDATIMQILIELSHGKSRELNIEELGPIRQQHETTTGGALIQFKKLQDRHPCMGGEANKKVGRIHLPVSPTCNIQCKFCTRCFDKSVIRPGVTSLLLKPEETIDVIARAKVLCPELTVVGIAGPGDTLATNQALETFALVKKHYPEMICCLSTNGFRLPDKVDRIAEIGIETITVTVNAVDPEIEAQINDFVIDEKGVRHDGVEGAALLIEHQLDGIKRAVEHGIVVKINSVLVPGVNDHHIEEIARVTSELGASLHNIIPLIPQNQMADIPAPDCEMIDRVRAESGKHLTVFRHCQHCRADSCGIPGSGKDLHSQLYDREVAETFSHG